ncbi:hypothetical protein [Deinococcus alpinitundrae]|uniref:hypothetical protein n=1 Tax=Deinococcus alpinitundrae TaxID=468913 RepID=UPI0027B8AC2D|nr:hypothetical protein [Deinococcus alpinitundrae]
MNLSHRRFASLLLSGLLLTACTMTSRPTTQPPQTRLQDSRVFTAATPTFPALPGASVYQGGYDGEHGKAGYVIEVPDK